MLEAQWPATTRSMTPDTSIIEAVAGEDAWRNRAGKRSRTAFQTVRKTNPPDEKRVKSGTLRGGPGDYHIAANAGRKALE
jgi:hypothetical protein